MILNGIMWIARSRAPWWDFPERHGPWETVYSRFRKWIDNSILDNIFRVLCRFVKHLVQREIQRKQQVFLSERARQEGA